VLAKQTTTARTVQETDGSVSLTEVNIRSSWYSPG